MKVITNIIITVIILAALALSVVLIMSGGWFFAIFVLCWTACGVALMRSSESSTNSEVTPSEEWHSDADRQEPARMIDGITYDISRSNLVVSRERLSNKWPSHTYTLFRLFVDRVESRPFLHVRSVDRDEIGFTYPGHRDVWYTFRNKHELLNECRWMSESRLWELMDADLTYHNPRMPM